MVNHSGVPMDRNKKCYDKIGLIPTQIMVAYLEINAFPMGKSLFSCHIKRILPPLGITLSWFDQNATERKINVFPMDLKP